MNGGTIAKRVIMDTNDISTTSQSRELMCAWDMYLLYSKHDKYGAASKMTMAEAGLVQINQNRPAAASSLSAVNKGVKR